MKVAFLVTDYPTPSGAADLRLSSNARRSAGPRRRDRGGRFSDAEDSGRDRRSQAPSLAPCGSRIPERYELGNVIVHRPRHWQLPKANYLGSRHGAFARCLMESVRSKPDVIHAHFAYPSGLAALKAGSKWQVPVVLTLHGSDVNFAPSVNWRTRRIFLRAVRGATFLSAVSAALAEKTEGLSGRRPVILPIGVDLRRYADLPDRDEARRRLGLPAGRPIVLFVGTLLEAKGVLVLKNALERLDRTGRPRRLRGRRAAPPRARRLGAASGASAPFPTSRSPCTCGRRTSSRCPRFRRGCRRCWSRPAPPGSRSSRAAVGGIPELLGDDRGLLVPARDESALAAALEATLDDPAAARRRASRLEEVIHGSYDADANARSWMKIYEGLLRSRAASGPFPAGSSPRSRDARGRIRPEGVGTRAESRPGRGAARDRLRRAERSAVDRGSPDVDPGAGGARRRLLHRGGGRKVRGRLAGDPRDVARATPPALRARQPGEDRSGRVQHRDPSLPRRGRRRGPPRQRPQRARAGVSGGGGADPDGDGRGDRRLRPQVPEPDHGVREGLPGVRREPARTAAGLLLAADDGRRDGDRDVSRDPAGGVRPDRVLRRGDDPQPGHRVHDAGAGGGTLGRDVARP